MDRVRFAIVGCGEIAVATAEGIAAAAHAALSMAMDTVQSLAQDLAHRFGGRATTNFEEVLTSPDVDAVYIATPHYLHAPMAIAAAQAGKHVLLEKPIATNVADAKAIISHCEAEGVTLGIAFLAQVDQACQEVRRLLAEGAIGEVVGVRYAVLADKPAHYWRGGYTQRVQTDWRGSKAKAGGGILIMNLIHNFNAVRFLTGLEATRVYGEYGTYSTPVEVEDLVFATVRYHNGAIGCVEGGSAVRGGAAGADGDRIFGTEGQVVLGREVRVYSASGAAGLPAGEWTTMTPDQPTVRARLVEEFALAVLNGEQPPVTGYDGLKALEIVEGIYRSGELCQPVYLPL